MQLAAARVITYLNRCDVLDNTDPKVIYKSLPTLVRLTKKDYSPETRILAADTLAFLIETSPDLQRMASISNHLIPTVASFLWWDPSSDHCNNMIELNGFMSRQRMEQMVQRR